MGLLDFAKDVGRQIFDTDAEAADNIKEHLEIKMTGIENIEVKYDDGVATICGDCINEATHDLAILIAGNVKGVERVVADDLRYPAPEPAATSEPEVISSTLTAEPAPEKPKVEYYDIVSGDTLGGIAKKFYGDASMYMKIQEANKELIPDPDKIYAGQKIIIPLE